MASSRLASLTPRERDCLLLVREGKSSKEIAKELDLSPYTVNEYIRDAVVKLGAENRRAAARMLFADQPTIPPEELGDEPPEVAAASNSGPAIPLRMERGKRWRVPFLRQGRQFNDLTALQRLGWIVLGAVAIVVLFSQLSQGMLVIQSMFQGR